MYAATVAEAVIPLTKLYSRFKLYNYTYTYIYIQILPEIYVYTYSPINLPLPAVSAGHIIFHNEQLVNHCIATVYKCTVLSGHKTRYTC